MSTFTGLSTMVRGIFNSQTALNTVGHNITNASTEGYSRQSANSVSTNAELRSGLYGSIAVGTGVEVQSITRSRDIFADKQFRNETSTQSYYESLARNYDSLEVIFDDSGEVGMAKVIGNFYQSWVDLSASASDQHLRTVAINQGKVICDLMKTDTDELQKQINATYDDVKLHVKEFNEILKNIVNTNKMIVAREATGASANDLRDQRDLLVDELSKYVNVNVTETSVGHYQINSGGVMLVNGIDRLHFEMSRGFSSASTDADVNVTTDYGVSDYNIVIKESHQVFVPQNGILKAEFDVIDECKSYIDHMASIANYMLTTFNDQHKAGYDATGNVGQNFFGDQNKTYEYSYDTQTQVSYVTMTDSTTKEVKKLTGVKIIEQFDVSSRLLSGSGYDYVAAATRYAVRDVDATGNLAGFTDYSKVKFKDLDTAKREDGSGYILNWNSSTKSSLSSADSDTTVYYSGASVGIGDGTNAVYLSELFNLSYGTIVETGRLNSVVIQRYADPDSDAINNMLKKYGDTSTMSDDKKNALIATSEFDKFINSINRSCINDYYTTTMTQLAVNAYTMDKRIEQQDALMVQIQNWRDSASGVDWNEELTNMIKYQKAYSSCARCLTAMDECLDRLVNNTGTVGR